MKTFFTLLIIALAANKLNAQAILNEVYPFPSAGNNEFFEFFNSSTSPVSMDNYTVVSYYEEGSKKGFFVMDLPNLSVGPRGYFVGSSAIPFNYQGITNSTSSNFSWNDLAFMASNNGYLRKWEMNNAVTTDGNAFYDLAAIPANYNDVFEKLGGGGASYNVFVYKNGVLADVFLGGTGGSASVPANIISMPALHVDMTGSSTDFDIDFSTYGSTKAEYVTQDIGTDNGYIRLVDGYCGTWTKSSSQITHTPGATNGGDPSKITGVVSVSSAIVRGNATTGSTINYDVVGGSASVFPVTLNLFIDNGSVPGELDAGDMFIDSKTENAVSDGPFSTVFFPYQSNILIQTVTSAGCVDALRFIPNTGVLPVRFTGFQAEAVANYTELKWYVAENQTGKQFEIEKSTDGKNFYSAGLIFSTTKTGSETYKFREALSETKIFYRIKLTDYNNKISYSNILAVGLTMKTSANLSLNQNPVESYLVFQFKSPENSSAMINIYNTSGAMVYSQKTNLTKEVNTVAINLDGKVFTGMYILEVKTPFDHNSVKFIKH